MFLAAVVTSKSVWNILVYRLPSHPSRHRLSVWRKLVSLGGVYVQDGVCALPKRDDLDENILYVANQIEEAGGHYHLLNSSATEIEDAKLKERFIALADERLIERQRRLVALIDSLDGLSTIAELEHVEEELKRERVAFLKVLRLNFFGSNEQQKVQDLLEEARTRLDFLARGGK